MSARDQAKFWGRINKTTLFLGKFYFLIIGAVQIFNWIYKICHIFAKVQLVIVGAWQILKSHQQNCFNCAKFLARDNTGSSNFQENV